MAYRILLNETRKEAWLDVNEEMDEEDMKTIASEVVRHNPISSLVVDKTQRPTEHSVVTPILVKKMFSML